MPVAMNGYESKSGLKSISASGGHLGKITAGFLSGTNVLPLQSVQKGDYRGSRRMLLKYPALCD